jgi:hypothetical protein
LLGLKINKRLIQNANFIHPDTGHAKEYKPLENEAKTCRSIDINWTKKLVIRTLDINFIA